jgi:hypothetical protein
LRTPPSREQLFAISWCGHFQNLSPPHYRANISAVSFCLEAKNNEGILNMSITTRRRALALVIPSLAAAVAPGAANAINAPTVQPADDPVLGLIAKYESLGNESKKLEAADVEDEDDSEWQSVQRDLWDVIRELFSTAPTTPAGVAAWSRFLGRHDPFFDDSMIGLVGHDEEFQQMMAHQVLAAAAVLTRVQA